MFRTISAEPVDEIMKNFVTIGSHVLFATKLLHFKFTLILYFAPLDVFALKKLHSLSLNEAGTM